jgi:hypothetical protein
MSLKKLHGELAHGVLYVEVEDASSDKHIGTAFHVGEGVFVTANHVVADKRVTAVGTNVTTFRTNPRKRTDPPSAPQEYVVYPRSTFTCEGVFTSKSGDDVALLRIPTAAHVPLFLLGTHLNELMGDEMLLSRVLVMGYPPIPFADDAPLVSVVGEVNAISHKRETREARYGANRIGGRYRGHPHFIISSTARGGFSGAPAVHEHGYVLGLVTESLVEDNEQPLETGYMAVLSVEPIYPSVDRSNPASRGWVKSGQLLQDMLS